MPLWIDALTMNKNFVRKPPNKLLSTKLPVCGAVEIYGLQNQGISTFALSENHRTIRNLFQAV